MLGATAGGINPHGGCVVTANLTLEEALRQCLDDDNKISKYEARVIHELVVADGQIDATEKELIRQALESNKLDEKAMEILSGLLMRAEMKM